jgi:mRNA-degrading endonuclease toxin of MazEF toxin-antitoxin module
MKAWEIWTGNIYGQHPCVLISCQARIDSKPQVVVLMCTSMKPGQEREARHNEAVLDSADGLDWKTLCRCDLLFTVDKASLKQKRGEVTVERRRDIARKLIQGLAIAGL